MSDEVTRTLVRLETLSSKWHGCTRCGLAETRLGDGIFFGLGAPQPRFLIVGGTPTAADEEAETLYAGGEGGLLFRLLDEAGVNENECSFTYAVSCRPKVYIPATETEEERIESRPPSKEETVACRPRLYEILYLTDPLAIITVGEVATKAMVRGKLPRYVELLDKQQFTCTLFPATPEDHADGKVEGKARYQPLTYPVFPIPDMPMVLNNPSTAEHGPYQQTLKILKKARSYVQFVLDNERRTMGK
jgi:uracil-DNA glycosylase family 4